MIDESEQWILNLYRTSEISGSLFFGRLAKSMKPGPIQRDMTKHFSDEAMHAWYWMSCIQEIGAEATQIKEAYQEQYLAAVGLPANLMEVLALTQVFEKRVIHQYQLHSQSTTVHPAVQRTLAAIMNDEKWHIRWIHDALKSLEPEYGADLIQATFKRFWEADQLVYGKAIAEHAERVQYLAAKAGGEVA